MNIRLLVAAILALAPSIAFAQWTAEQKTLATVAITAFVIDYGQTRDLVFRQQHRDCRYGCFTERNPFLGKHPSQSRVNSYFVLAPIVSYIALDGLSSEARTLGLRGLTAIELAAVGNNVHLGLSVRF